MHSNDGTSAVKLSDWMQAALHTRQGWWGLKVVSFAPPVPLRYCVWTLSPFFSQRNWIAASSIWISAHQRNEPSLSDAIWWKEHRGNLKITVFSPLFYDKLYVVFHQQCNGLSFKYPYWDDIPTHLSQLYAESPTVGMAKQFWHWSVCCTIKHLIMFINKWMDEDNCQTTCYCGRAQSPTLFPKQKQSDFCLHIMVDIFNDFLFCFVF